MLFDFSQLLDTVGNGTGTTNAIGNYSGAATDFKLVYGGNQITLTRFSVLIVDSSDDFKENQYGGIAALTNGITVRLKSGGLPEARLFRPSVAIKNTAGWISVMSEYRSASFPDAKRPMLGFTFDFTNRLLLNTAGDYFLVRLNDNFTGLDWHIFSVFGLIES